MLREVGDERGPGRHGHIGVVGVRSRGPGLAPRRAARLVEDAQDALAGGLALGEGDGETGER
ncbi:hypothetical protein ACFVRD_44750 [Streptomyces sp. NPDC057908]|uniref:hypothetical protein n=1 Tax=Streptomyces sp. NPDC057908 TaxID=3346276 RepID=UPI0036E8F386